MFHGSDFMFKKLNILDEKDKKLRLISKDAVFPLSKEYKVKLFPFDEKGIDEYVMLYATEKEVLDLNIDKTFLEYMANSAINI